jgi:hypothetical protein
VKTANVKLDGHPEPSIRELHNITCVLRKQVNIGVEVVASVLELNSGVAMQIVQDQHMQIVQDQQ